VTEGAERCLELRATERGGRPGLSLKAAVGRLVLFDDAVSLRERPDCGPRTARPRHAVIRVERMDLEQARHFVREHHRAVIATRRADGLPQLSLVAASVDASGRLIVSSRETAFKTKNLRRDPNVSICVFTDGFWGPWVQIDGTAEVISLPEAMDGFVEYYRSISGEHPDWDDYRNAMERERRVLLAVTMSRAGPDRQG